MLGLSYRVPCALLSRSWSFLRDRGTHGCEGMLLWAGKSEPPQATLTRLVIPAQTAIKTRLGVCVAMHESAQHEMPRSLKSGEQYLIRVHSHPARAFHSETDDENLVLSHDGAISIVVPNFCNRDYVLAECAVFEYCFGSGWRALFRNEIVKRFTLL
jgi:hypothetical protein